jgi:hypothetical protein
MTLFGNNLHQVHSKVEILENTRTCHCNLKFEYTVCDVTITKHHGRFFENYLIFGNSLMTNAGKTNTYTYICVS